MKINYKVTVSASLKQYPIYIGHGLDRSDLTKKYEIIALITDKNVFNIYQKQIDELIKGVPKSCKIVIESGEQHKNLSTAEYIYTRLVHSEITRDSLIIAFGGGLVGDISGFAASTYMRGIDFLQIPTTLLAMTDSSIGGKTGVNLGKAKNMIGSFYHPIAVYCDTFYLSTLSKRQFNSGLMEVIKYGLILDVSFFEYICENIDSIIKKDREKLAYIVYKSCLFKAEIVREDEKEKGLRSILNFGHTIGHALESYTDYKYYLHGEAVALGALIMVSYLAQNSWQFIKLRYDLIDLFVYIGLPVSIPADFDADDILSLIKYDKKRYGAKSRWVLLEEPGKAIFNQQVDMGIIKQIIESLKKR